MKNFLAAFALVCCSIVTSSAQDSVYVRKVITKLASPTYWGRGYTKNGMAKAANFIAREFKSFGLLPLSGEDYKQSFSYAVNTFPGKMNLRINGEKMIAGKNFLVNPASKGSVLTTELLQRDSINFSSPDQKIVVTLQDKLTWSVARKVDDFTQVLVYKPALINQPKTLTVNIENKFVSNFTAANICGLVKGTLHPDSIIFITAHYDHLGGMGKNTYFPGANDNASGVAFLLSLAKYYAKHPQPYSIGFLCFAGEEAGILGSKYFTDHPLVPLASIRFLFNIDMVGTGEKGATVVNATLHQKEFAALLAINKTNNYLPTINPRGKAANSDHYFFTAKGVPAFFMYTQGGISAYHDIFDKAETLPLTVYNNLFQLFLAFNKSLQNYGH